MLLALVILYAERIKFFILEGQARFVLDFHAAQRKQLVVLSFNFFALNALERLQIVNVLHGSIILSLQVAMQRVQAVEFGLELKPELDLFLLRLDGAGDLLLEFESLGHFLLQTLA